MFAQYDDYKIIRLIPEHIYFLVWNYNIFHNLFIISQKCWILQPLYFWYWQQAKKSKITILYCQNYVFHKNIGKMFSEPL